MPGAACQTADLSAVSSIVKPKEVIQHALHISRLLRHRGTGGDAPWQVHHYPGAETQLSVLPAYASVCRGIDQTAHRRVSSRLAGCRYGIPYKPRWDITNIPGQSP